MTIGKSYALHHIRGLDGAQTAALKQAGIANTRALLEAAPDRASERKLAKAAGLPQAVVREAVNRADLMRISGIGGATADFFENAGVNSVKELALRRPDALAKTLAALDAAHPELAYRLPNPTTVAALVEKAKALLSPEPAPAPAPAPAVSPVATAGEARPAAEAALHAHIDDVLFSDDPAGANFRDAVLGWRPSTEWPQVQAKMHAEVDRYFADAEVYEKPDRFVFVGSLMGLYTEVDVVKATGQANRVYVEID